MSDVLFGTLQTPLKPIHYTGIDTETVDVIVNNKDRTISAKLQPDILNSIESNLNNIQQARQYLNKLQREIDELETVIDRLTIAVGNDISELKERATNLEDKYATIEYVDEKILEVIAGDVDIQTYAKVEYVDSEVTNLQNTLTTSIDTKLSQKDFNTYQLDVANIISQINTDIETLEGVSNTTQQSLNILEEAIGPLPVDKTLKEEIYDTFTTKEDFAQSIEDFKEEVSNTYATKLSLNAFYDKDEIDSKLDDITSGGADLTNYYTKGEVYNKTEIDEMLKDLPEGGGTIDPEDINLDNYYTKQQTDDKIDQKLSNYISSIEFIEAQLPQRT